MLWLAATAAGSGGAVAAMRWEQGAREFAVMAVVVVVLVGWFFPWFAGLFQEPWTDNERDLSRLIEATKET